jgi:hypothetical protein
LSKYEAVRAFASNSFGIQTCAGENVGFVQNECLSGDCQPLITHYSPDTKRHHRAVHSEISHMPAKQKRFENLKKPDSLMHFAVVFVAIYHAYMQTIYSFRQTETKYVVSPV